MSLAPLTQNERFELRDMLEEVRAILKKPPFRDVHLSDIAKRLRAPGESWPSKGLVWVGLNPELPNATSRRFYERVHKLHHAITYQWPKNPTSILRFGENEEIIVLENFDPYDPSSLSWGGSLRQPGDLMILNGNEDLPQGVLIMGSPEKVTECDICGQPLYKTVWNKKRHSGACQERARKLRSKSRRATKATRNSGGGE